MKAGYRLALAVSAAFVLLAYKSFTIAPLAPGPILLGWALETTVLGAAWAASAWAQSSRRAALRIAAAGLFYVVLYLVIVPSLAHTFFYESAAERRFSLLEIDLRTLAYFFTRVLPLRGALGLAALFAVIHLLPFAIRPLLGALRLRVVASAVLAAGALLAVALAHRSRIPSPLADMGADLWEQLTTPEVVVDRTQPARHDPRQLDKSRTVLPEQLALPFDRVLVFVMETMTSDMFAREQRALPASTFVHRAREHAHVYSRYFATNQDSRTGMLAMLGSRFIPYEAYTEAGRDHYMFLGERSSLVDHFKALGFTTAFAVSQAEIELVVGDLPWDELIHLNEAEVDRLSRQVLCFVPYEFEHSCEDRALLPRVLEFLDRHPRAFLYQEFIWGHASEYNRASGKTNTEYYSAYLDAVIEHLSHTGALGRTLIVLTSDHGFRDKGLQSQPAVYHIPLLLFSPSFAPREDARLFSHLDFKDLVFHAMWPEAVPVQENAFVMAVGPTGTSFIAVLTQPGQFMLLKARAGARYLVHAEGPRSARAATAEAAGFLRLYEDYLGYFAAQ